MTSTVPQVKDLERTGLEKNSASTEQSSKLQLERKRLVMDKRSIQSECNKLQTERDELKEKLSQEQATRQDAIVQAQEISLKLETFEISS